MEKQSVKDQARFLRDVAARLNNSNPSLPSQLVLTAQQAIPALTFCKSILSATDAQLKLSQTDAGVAVHSFCTKLTSLLQDKSSAARLAGVTLVKATVHLGGYEVLSKNGSIWARSILSSLNRPGHVASKRLMVLVLVQIYRATHNLPNLTREVTTPTLKDFIPVCIGLITTKDSASHQQKPNMRSQLLTIVLQAFVKLIPHHPNVFRPFVKTLSSICSQILSLTSADATLWMIVKPEAFGLAQRLLSQLPRCAADKASAEEWDRNVHLIKEHIFQTADEVFRSIIESSHSGFASRRTQYKKALGKNIDQPAGQIDDDLHLGSWTGLEPGVDRMVSLLQTLQAHIAVRGPSSTAFALPVDLLLNIVERVMSVFPGQRADLLSAIASNTEISREERERLFFQSSRIQIEAVNTLSVLCQRLGTSSVSITVGILEHLVWCFGTGIPSELLRASYYDVTSTMIRLCGAGLSSKVVQSLNAVVRSACDDVYARVDSSAQGQASQNSADAYLNNASKSKTTLKLGPAHENAKALLHAILRYIPAEAIPNALRAIIDKNIVLLRDEESMLASVLNSSNQKPFTAAHYSILPYLAREHADSMRTEAIIRPRLPILARRQKTHDVDEEDEDVENAEYTGNQNHGSSTTKTHHGNDSDREEESQETRDQACRAVLHNVKHIRAYTPPPEGAHDNDSITNRSKALAATWGSLELPVGAENCLKGLSICFTGRVRGLSPEDGISFIERHGGKVVESISKHTNFVMLGVDADPKKLKLIRELDLKCIDESGLLHLVRNLPAGGVSAEVAKQHALDPTGQSEDPMHIDSRSPAAERVGVIEKPSPFVPQAVTTSATCGLPQSPKRGRGVDDEDENVKTKKVKLATFEPAPGPTSVSVITTSGNVQVSEDDGTDSDHSSLPSIHMDDVLDDEDEDD